MTSRLCEQLEDAINWDFKTYPKSSYFLDLYIIFFLDHQRGLIPVLPAVILLLAYPSNLQLMVVLKHKSFFTRLSERSVHVHAEWSSG